MSIREFLLARRRKLSLFGIAVWLGTFIAGFVAFKYHVPWLRLPFFALLAVVVLLAIRWTKCPRCGGSLGAENATLSGRSLYLTGRIDFCPYCGVSLDEPWDKL